MSIFRSNRAANERWIGHREVVTRYDVCCSRDATCSSVAR